MALNINDPETERLARLLAEKKEKRSPWQFVGHSKSAFIA